MSNERLYPKPTIQQSINSWHLVLDLIELGFPHNFQHEPSWIVDYMKKITKIINRAYKVREDADKT